VKPKEIPMTQSPVLLHVWSVRPEQQDALVTRLAEMFGRVSAAPGFVSARMLTSADRTSIAAVVEMRSAEDRERLEALPAVRETLDGVRGAYNLVARLYQQIGTYGVEADDPR
jgi:heme-degrading monooxygenase HmoA